MTLDDFIAQLEGVRRAGRGVMARCPGHDDRSPSLSIDEGEDGRILLHDFGGCTPQQIMAALGLELRDLFADSLLPHSHRPVPKSPRINRAALAFGFEVAAFDRRMRADHILDSAQDLNVSMMTEAELDRAVRSVGQAYSDQEQAERFEDVADSLREKEFAERSIREQTCAA